jgi:hypothetical protein
VARIRHAERSTLLCTAAIVTLELLNVRVHTNKRGTLRDCGESFRETSFGMLWVHAAKQLSVLVATHSHPHLKRSIHTCVFTILVCIAAMFVTTFLILILAAAAAVAAAHCFLKEREREREK